mmetsp:Transcript_25353/g.73141  ORF Transcript_25353/g.73141 Transcript_25353/m.73141 type:complete len:319 (-) Transcript_25353:448-1404(-)
MQGRLGRRGAIGGGQACGLHGQSAQRGCHRTRFGEEQLPNRRSRDGARGQDGFGADEPQQRGRRGHSRQEELFQGQQPPQGQSFHRPWRQEQAGAQPREQASAEVVPQGLGQKAIHARLEPNDRAGGVGGRLLWLRRPPRGARLARPLCAQGAEQGPHHEREDGHERSEREERHGPAGQRLRGPAFLNVPGRRKYFLLARTCHRRRTLRPLQRPGAFRRPRRRQILHRLRDPRVAALAHQKGDLQGLEIGELCVGPKRLLEVDGHGHRQGGHRQDLHHLRHCRLFRAGDAQAGRAQPRRGLVGLRRDAVHHGDRQESL